MGNAPSGDSDPVLTKMFFVPSAHYACFLQEIKSKRVLKNGCNKCGDGIRKDMIFVDVYACSKMCIQISIIWNPKQKNIGLDLLMIKNYIG